METLRNHGIPSLLCLIDVNSCNRLKSTSDYTSLIKLVLVTECQTNEKVRDKNRQFGD